MQDPTQNSQRVLRRQNGIIGGVCGGLGAYFGVSPWLFRILFLFLHVPGIMPGLLLYIVLWVAIPKAEATAPTNQTHTSRQRILLRPTRHRSRPRLQASTTERGRIRNPNGLLVGPLSSLRADYGYGGDSSPRERHRAEADRHEWRMIRT